VDAAFGGRPLLLSWRMVDSARDRDSGTDYDAPDMAATLFIKA